MLKKTKELLKELRRGHGRNNYGFVCEEDFYAYPSEVCYCGFLSYKSNITRPIKYFAEWCFYDRTLQPYTLPYLEWAAHHSPWSGCFITKDPEEIWRNGCIFSTDFSGHYVLQAAIVLRYLYDYPNNVAAWFQMKDHMDPSEAFILCHWFGYQGADVYSQIIAGYGHCIWEWRPTKELLTAMLSKDRSKGVQEKFSSFFPLMKAWGMPPWGLHNKFTFTNLTTETRGKGWDAYKVSYASPKNFQALFKELLNGS